MPSTYLGDSDRVVRFVPWGKLRKDEDDNVLGVLGVAFALRDGEAGLSVTWCEYFKGTSDEMLRCAIEAIRNSDMKVGAKAQFSVAQVEYLKSFASENGKKFRFIHEPEDDNAAHAAVRGWIRPEEDDLLELIAEDYWCELIDKSTADQLPLCDCEARIVK